LTTIKEILAAALKLETLNEFFIDKNKLTIKLNEKNATIYFQNFLDKYCNTENIYLQDLTNLVDYIKSVLDCNFSHKALVIEYDINNAEIKILSWKKTLAFLQVPFWFYFL